jgi:hypothetical protein
MTQDHEILPIDNCFHGQTLSLTLKTTANFWAILKITSTFEGERIIYLFPLQMCSEKRIRVSTAGVSADDC